MYTAVNIVFTLLFLIFFCLIVWFFSGYFMSAYHLGKLYPHDKGLPISNCQIWTNEVTKFDLEDDEKAERVPVLMYHRIIDEKHISDIHYDENGNLYKTIVLTEEFAKQMKLLHEHGYITLNTKEFQLFMEGKLNVPKKSVLITFDDGYKDNYINAYPILKSYDFNAALYLVTGWITKHEQKYQPDQTQYLSESDLRKSCPVFEFQSHTYNMHYRTKDGTSYLLNKSATELLEDFKASFTNLNGENRSFAYPYGVYEESNIKQLKKLGVKMAFTTEFEFASRKANMYEIPRLSVFPDDTLEDFKNKIGLDTGKQP